MTTVTNNNALDVRTRGLDEGSRGKQEITYLIGS